MYLVDSNGLKIVPAMKLESFRGEFYTVVSFQEPHKEGSTGRIIVADDEGRERSLYPSVFDLEWIDDPAEAERKKKAHDAYFRIMTGRDPRG